MIRWFYVLAFLLAVLPGPEPAVAQPALDRGMVVQSEADRLLAQGDPQAALDAYRLARGFYEAAGSAVGQANTWLREATLVLMQADADGALTAYRNARRFYEAAGSKLGEGQTWYGEGDVLAFLERQPAALAAYRKARSLFEEIGDTLAQGNAWRGEADVVLRMGRPQAALDAFRTARGLFETAGEPIGQGNAWRGEGDVLNLLGKPEAALEAYRRARGLFAAAGDRRGEANARLGAGDLLFRVGRNAEALDAYRAARELFEAVGDRLGMGSTWRGEAAMLLLEGDLDAALAAYRTARELLTAVGSQSGVANALRGEADVLLRRGDVAAALAAYRAARLLYEAAGNRLGVGNAWLGEGEALSIQGEYVAALAGYRTARRLYEEVQEPLGVANALRGEATLFFRLGDDLWALVAYGAARQRYQAIGESVGEANTWQGEAEVLRLAGDGAAALAAYRAARGLYQAVGDRLSPGSTWQGEAEVLALSGNAAAALAAYRTARRLLEADNPVGQSESWRGEAEVLLSLGEDRDAARAAGRGAELAAAGGDRDTEIRCLLAEAQARRRLGELEPAARLAERAIERFDDRRAGFVTDLQRLWRQNLIQPAHDLLISTLWRLERPLAALQRAEEARSRVLLDLVATGHAVRRREAGAASGLAWQREGLVSELAGIDRELSGGPTAERRKDLLRERVVREALVERLGFEILLSAGSLMSAGEPLDLDGIRAAAREVGPLLLFYAASEETYVFLLRDGAEPVARALALSRDDLRRRAGELSEALANPNYEQRAAALTRELLAALLGPVAERLPAGGPLTLILHGPLHRLPFEALTDPAGRALFERFDVALAPSLSTLRHVRGRHRPARADDTLLALAAGEGLRRPAAEVREIAGFFDPRQAASFEPPAADHAAYESRVPRARHLVIATQGRLTPGNRRQTYLEIEPSESHDRRLTAAEIASLPIDAELVTLAACDTAAAEALLSDERLDLTRAFLVAGAAAVLATRWKLPEDDRTSRFLTDFYRAYRQGGADGRGMRKDQALTEARRRSRERDDPAQIWAAWVLVGDAR